MTWSALLWQHRRLTRGKIVEEFSNADLLKVPQINDTLFKGGIKCYETKLTRDERYLINKTRSDYIQKLENNQPERTNPEDAIKGGCDVPNSDNI